MLSREEIVGLRFQEAAERVGSAVEVLRDRHRDGVVRLEELMAQAPETYHRLLACISEGGQPSRVAAAYGIPARVFAEWIERGERSDDAADCHRRLYLDVDAARNQALMRAERRVYAEDPRFYLSRIGGWGESPDDRGSPAASRDGAWREEVGDADLVATLEALRETGFLQEVLPSPDTVDGRVVKTAAPGAPECPETSARREGAQECPEAPGGGNGAPGDPGD